MITNMSVTKGTETWKGLYIPLSGSCYSNYTFLEQVQQVVSKDVKLENIEYKIVKWKSCVIEISHSYWNKTFYQWLLQIFNRYAFNISL